MLVCILSKYVCMFVYIYVCMYVTMRVCMCVCGAHSFLFRPSAVACTCVCM